MAVIQLALALCVLATVVTGCSHHAEALVANSTAEAAHERSLLTTTHSDGTRIVRKCGVATTSVLKKQAIQRRVQPHIAARISNSERYRSTNIIINVYVTVNRNGDLGVVSQGDIPDSDIAQQIAFMNNAYSSSPVRFFFTFTLVSTTRIRVAAWWNLDINSQAYTDYKVAAHQGNFADLNILTTSLQNNILGVTTLPWDGTVQKDAAMIHPGTWFGGQFNGYNLGATTVHEVGHWLGLLHPFDGGCSEPNDYIDDTAEEAAPQFECPNPAPNSCPNKPINQPIQDPIHSYMDYSPDACMNSFTPGQVTQMSGMWDAYRASSHKNSVPQLPKSPPSPPPPRPPSPPPRRKKRSGRHVVRPRKSSKG